MRPRLSRQPAGWPTCAPAGRCALAALSGRQCDQIETATGRRLGQELTRRIIRPLGLGDTFFPVNAPGIPGPRPSGWDPVESPLLMASIGLAAAMAGLSRRGRQ